MISTFVEQSAYAKGVLASLIKLPIPKNSTAIVCENFLMGGKVSHPDHPERSCISPSFRSARAAVDCITTWNEGTNVVAQAEIDQLSHKILMPLGNGGIYLNQPWFNAPNWKRNFWGSESVYERLLKVKHQVDPDNFFTCHQCVGSD